MFLKPYKIGNDKIVIYQPVYKFLMKLIPLFMLFSGIYIIFTMLYDPEIKRIVIDDFTAFDWFGLLFLIMWSSLLAYGCKITYRMSGYKMTVDKNGITVKYFLSNAVRTIKWDDVKEYGYMLSGQINHVDNHVIYFSSSKIEELPKKQRKFAFFNNERLRDQSELHLSQIKNIVQIDINESDLDSFAVDVLFPFCMRFTKLQPTVIN